MNSGNRPVSSIFFASVALGLAAQAGRVGEDGSGAMRIAPELVRSPETVDLCSIRTEPQALELVFETIEWEDASDARSALAHSRTGVEFQWNPATGELSFAGTVPAPVFSDVAPSVPHGATISDHCARD